MILKRTYTEQAELIANYETLLAQRDETIANLKADLAEAQELIRQTEAVSLVELIAERDEWEEKYREECIERAVYEVAYKDNMLAGSDSTTAPEVSTPAFEDCEELEAMLAEIASDESAQRVLDMVNEIEAVQSLDSEARYLVVQGDKDFFYIKDTKINSYYAGNGIWNNYMSIETSYLTDNGLQAIADKLNAQAQTDSTPACDSEAVQPMDSDPFYYIEKDGKFIVYNLFDEDVYSTESAHEAQYKTTKLINGYWKMKRAQASHANISEDGESTND